MSKLTELWHRVLVATTKDGTPIRIDKVDPQHNRLTAPWSPKTVKKDINWIDGNEDHNEPRHGGGGKRRVEILVGSFRQSKYHLSTSLS